MWWYWEMKALFVRRPPASILGGTLFILEILQYFLVHNVDHARFLPYSCTLCAKRTGIQVSVIERNCISKERLMCIFSISILRVLFFWDTTPYQWVTSSWLFGTGLLVSSTRMFTFYDWGWSFSSCHMWQELPEIRKSTAKRWKRIIVFHCRKVNFVGIRKILQLFLVLGQMY